MTVHHTTMGQEAARISKDGRTTAGLVAAGLVAAGCVLAAFAAGLVPARAPAPALRITVEQLDGATLRVVYRWREPRAALAFRPVGGEHRARRWSIEGEAFLLRSAAGRERIERADGAPFAEVALTARPDAARQPKDYSPVAAYGEGGALVYTGHFWPLDEAGARIEASFDFLPAPGGAATAFGAAVPALVDWRSPTGAAAFVYLGPLAPRMTGRFAALVDPAAPGWVRRAFHDVSARAFDYFAQSFSAQGFSNQGFPDQGFSSPALEGAPRIAPTLFLTAAPGGEPGRLRFAGDAAPGQFQVTLEGGGWDEESAAARDMLRLSTIHEAFHLWQYASAQPETRATPAWIHEGAADIVAAEAMVALGYWDGVALRGFVARSRRDCAFGIEHGSLAAARLRGEVRALYGCGVVSGEAAARAGGTTASAFWRDFMAEAAARGGYTEATFYDFLAARAGAPFAEAARSFVRTPHARPAAAIDRLMAAAER